MLNLCNLFQSVDLTSYPQVPTILSFRHHQGFPSNSWVAINELQVSAARPSLKLSIPLSVAPDLQRLRRLHVQADAVHVAAGALVGLPAVPDPVRRGVPAQLLGRC